MRFCKQFYHCLYAREGSEGVAITAKTFGQLHGHALQSTVSFQVVLHNCVRTDCWCGGACSTWALSWDAWTHGPKGRQKTLEHQRGLLSRASAARRGRDLQFTDETPVSPGRTFNRSGLCAFHVLSGCGVRALFTRRHVFWGNARQCCNEPNLHGAALRECRISTQDPAGTLFGSPSEGQNQKNRHRSRGFVFSFWGEGAAWERNGWEQGVLWFCVNARCYFNCETCLEIISKMIDTHSMNKP